MDAFDFVDEEKPKRGFGKGLDFGNAMWNVGTIGFILLTVVLVIVFLAIYINPWIFLNLYPPPLAPPEEPPAGGGQPTTGEPTSIGGLVTPINTLAPTATVTPSGPLPTPTFIILVSPTPSVVVTPGGFRFVLQPGSLVYMNSATFFPSLGCNYMGIVGQVFDAEGASIVSQAVQVTGMLDGVPVNQLYYTQLDTEYGIGPYYEFKLADEPIASTASLEVKLLSQEGQQISDAILFNTFDDCSQNLIMINFVEVE